LNSYENRVYQVGIEDAKPLIAKFYRPGRWSDQQIIEEHDFSKRTGRPRIAGGGPLGAMLTVKACSIMITSNLPFIRNRAAMPLNLTTWTIC